MAAGLGQEESRQFEVGEGTGQGEHVHGLEVEVEEMLGGADDDLGDTDDVDVLKLGHLGPYRTNYRIIPFLVTNVINHIILENTMVIM